MSKDFYIKNMVCDRCIKVVSDELEKVGIPVLDIELGRIRVDINKDEQLSILREQLEKNGFSLIVSSEEKLVEDVKIAFIHLLDKLPIQRQRKLSVVLAQELATDYSKISKVFSLVEGITIEKYFIKLKIEKVKELIQEKEFNFTEISQLLDYSNVNHLSRQFKNETGMSLTDYKNQQIKSRNPLDEIM